MSDSLPAWYAPACALTLVIGVWLIAIDAWWGWIYVPIGLGGLAFWTWLR